MTELEQIKELLSEVYYPQGVEIWLTSPHKWFNGERAIDLINEGRSAEVLAAAERLAGGGGGS